MKLKNEKKRKSQKMIKMKIKFMFKKKIQK